MRRRLIIAPEAELDLDGLAAFIAEDSLETAVRLYEAAESVFQHLLSMPEIGATRDLGLNRLLKLVQSVFPNDQVLKKVEPLSGEKERFESLLNSYIGK